MLRSILMEYEEASRQKVNTDKSSIFFSPNTAQATRDEIFNILGPMQNLRHNKYLGLPSLTSRSKKQVFAILKERVGHNLRVGKVSFFLWVGKKFLSKQWL